MSPYIFINKLQIYMLFIHNRYLIQYYSKTCPIFFEFKTFPNFTNNLYLVPSVSCGVRYIASIVLGAISSSGNHSSVVTILSSLFPQKSTEDILICLLSSLIYKCPIMLRKGRLARDNTATPVKPAREHYL